MVIEEDFEIVNADDAVIFVEVLAETLDALLPLAETEFAIEVVPLESGEFTFTLNVAVCPVIPAAREFREIVISLFTELNVAPIPETVPKIYFVFVGIASTIYTLSADVVPVFRM